MRIGWVTPLAKTSSIGSGGLRICDALAERGHLVHIIRSEVRDVLDTPHQETPHRVLTWRDVPLKEAKQSYDAVFVNIGDNFNFHAGVFEYLKEPFAIGIFHDFYLFNLFNGWRHSLGLTANQALREIVTTYGPASSEAALRAIRGEMDITELSQAVPMTEWLAKRCAGAIAHAQFYVPRLLSTCAGVVEVLNLPFARRDIPPAVARDGRLTVTTVGVVNPNKCVDAVIDAIGQSAALREKVRYVVAGAADDAMRAALEGKARELGVDFQLLGRIEDDRLMQVLDEADIMCCLRRPVLEGASGSAIEAMLSGRATIIADAGFYGELPDRYVAKVPADFSPSDLARAIEGLAADAESRLRMGVEARSWALETFSGDAYAVMLESVVRDQARLEPYLELSDRVAKRLARLGFGGSSKIIGRFAAAIDGMRQPDPQSPHRV